MMRTVRFLTGLVMVVTGVSLAAPMATRLVEAHRGAANGVEAATEQAPAGPAAWAGAGPVSAPGPARAGGYCIPDPRSAVVTGPHPRRRSAFPSRATISTPLRRAISRRHLQTYSRRRRPI